MAIAMSHCRVDAAAAPGAIGFELCARKNCGRTPWAAGDALVPHKPTWGSAADQGVRPTCSNLHGTRPAAAPFKIVVRAYMKQVSRFVLVFLLATAWAPAAVDPALLGLLMPVAKAIARVQVGQAQASALVPY